MLVKRGVWAGTLPEASRLLLIKASCLENQIIYNSFFVYCTEILSMNHLYLTLRDTSLDIIILPMPALNFIV